jgi:CheY-like chemotaxis protein
MKGIEAARAIKENPSTVRMPIIAYTAWSVSTWMEQAASAGTAAYLVKPVPMALIKETIRDNTKVYSAVMNEGSGTGEKVAPSHGRTACFDLSAFRRSC